MRSTGQRQDLVADPRRFNQALGAAMRRRGSEWEHNMIVALQLRIRSVTTAALGLQ